MGKIKSFVNSYLFTISYGTSKKSVVISIILDIFLYLFVLPDAFVLMFTGSFFTGWILMLFVIAMFTLQCYKIELVKNEVIMKYAMDMFSENPRYNANGVFDMAFKHADEVMKKRNSKKV